MNILSDSTGKILGVGAMAGAVFYTGQIPVDFIDTFALGKYVMDKGVITQVIGWVAPGARGFTL